MDDHFMRRAIDLAARGLGTTSPNPVVGCVITSAGGSVVGEGFHAAAGGPHAEVWALREAGELARGGTAYVTLEPCDHHGRTGPCSEALLKAGIERVVVAVPDPNPVAAGGAERLRRAGVAVETGLLRAEAERGNAHWLTYTRMRRPFVTWKFAATLDGRSAAADGTSRWITSPEARADVHRLRAQHDAIMAGIGTVLADDPHLTVRPGAAKPLRVVVDSEGSTPPHAKVLDDAAPTLLAVGVDLPSAHAVRVPRGPHGLDLPALLTELHRRRIVSVFLEGGPTLAGSFLRAGLVDRVVAYLAPAFLGSGLSALGEAGVTGVGGIHRWEFEDVVPIGPDLRVTARPAPPKEN
ncbi:bifunctional diaminohydroxyphosphoribosylaminopyrimidine deaminase/5-amino-6-(5-phosphoribosylamino)uracil reductase RibD [Herbidospora yilanensis]|uniref:bifunctional diaminohydroxyphosphoribosylaminopyrimidine deaminase/5-amino-6-(5-phosphoribosylamino)uracil reductase RibD n=1 Tax=Herbidospora yilanensis TaxID=354426 RepID=UPI001E3DA55A|nr:bifunctional diaminohydroxyphosphoribosylaminopyrimidine deaminase/5-amino-6-(5-phosphoribosylamino)uracil reductase RibD [Herbidospora yilanensis]